MQQCIHLVWHINNYMNEYSFEASYDIRGKKGHFKVTLLNVDFNTNDGQFITKIAEVFHTLLF